MTDRTEYLVSTRVALTALKVGSESRTRTGDHPVNSRMHGAGDLTLQSMQFGIEEYLPRLRSCSEEVNSSRESDDG